MAIDAIQKNTIEARELLEKLETLSDAEKNTVLALIEGIRLGANISKTDKKESA